ncbi:MAG: metallophosphoesterase [Nanoarchaeota archaeon]
MYIDKNVKIIDLGLYLEKQDLLIVGDIHLGYEESLNNRGILVPRFQYKETVEKMKKMLDNVKPKKILINGDLKHEFGSIMSYEWKNVLNFIDFLQERCQELIIIKGNHDVILEPITKKKGILLIPYYKIDEYFICHGDKIFEEIDSKVIIIGNEHPAISLSKDGRKELYKCFLKGRYKKKKLIIMPSFNMLTIGSDIFQEKRLSPYIPKDLSKFKVYVAEDKIYNFGEVKNIKNYVRRTV